MRHGVARIVVSCALLAVLTWGNQGRSEAPKPSQVDPVPNSNHHLVFRKAFGKKANAKYILGLPNGFLIGFDHWEIDGRKGVMRLTNCFIVDGKDFPKKPQVAIRSKSGIVPMKGRQSEYRITNPHFADLIHSISFRDGSQFVFPNVVATDNSVSQTTVR